MWRKKYLKNYVNVNYVKNFMIKIYKISIGPKKASLKICLKQCLKSIKNFPHYEY